MHRHERATVKDVAHAAGVSTQTVSNVLRGQGRVGADTRARVVAAAEALGYTPHAGATSLRTGRTGRLAHPLAVARTGPANTIMLEFLEALTSAAGRQGQQLVLAADEGAGSGEPGAAALDSLLRAQAVDGVVLADVVPDDPRVASLAERGVPFVCFGRTAPDMPQTWVDVDNQGGVRATTERLIARDHRAIAFLGYVSQGAWDDQREQGYRDAMAAADLPAQLRSCERESRAAQAEIAALLDGDRRPTAIVTGSDQLARELYVAAGVRGLRIGSQLAVTGFDGSLTGRLLLPSLTTAAIPVQEIAERLVTRVLRELDGPTGDPGEIIAATIVDGDSA